MDTNNEALHEQLHGTTGKLLEVEEDMPIWRVFKAEHLVSSVRAKELVLVKPQLWEDPWDNYMRHVTIVDSEYGTSYSALPFIDRYYCQCWSASAPETDALWRIYCPNPARGIRVRSTVGSLFRALLDTLQGEPPIINFFGTRWRVLTYAIGRVRYDLDQSGLDWLQYEDAAAELIIDPTGVGMMNTLLEKRREFSHEAEVRVLYRDPQLARARRNDVCRLSVDVARLIEEVVIDPRFSQVEAEALTAELRKFGVVSPIEQSKLYQVPNIKSPIT